MTSNYPEVEKLAIDAYVYIPFNVEAITIRAVIVEEEIMYGTGEESGAEYAVEFSEVDLENDMFYKLELM